jgi:hypothetical protein
MDFVVVFSGHGQYHIKTAATEDEAIAMESYLDEVEVGSPPVICYVRMKKVLILTRAAFDRLDADRQDYREAAAVAGGRVKSSLWTAYSRFWFDFAHKNNIGRNCIVK